MMMLTAERNKPLPLILRSLSLRRHWIQVDPEIWKILRDRDLRVNFGHRANVPRQPEAQRILQR